MVRSVHQKYFQFISQIENEVWMQYFYFFFASKFSVARLYAISCKWMHVLRLNFKIAYLSLKSTETTFSTQLLVFPTCFVHQNSLLVISCSPMFVRTNLKKLNAQYVYVLCVFFSTWIHHIHFEDGYKRLFDITYFRVHFTHVATKEWSGLMCKRLCLLSLAEE